MELWSSDCDRERWYSGVSSFVEGSRVYAAGLLSTLRECDCRVAASGESSRRNILDNVVRERCSAEGRDGPASLVEGGSVEECNKRESLFVLLERIGSRRRLLALKRPLPSSLSAGCCSWPRSKLPKDDCRRRCVLLPPAAGTSG